jgi:hypothetical protein
MAGLARNVQRHFSQLCNDVVVRMTDITAKSVPCDPPLPEDMEIVRVEYAPNFLMVNTRSQGDSAPTLVEFADIIGFRVLDEGNLLEFWPECSSANGRLFEILAGGWLAQESLRPGSLFAPMKIQAKEYFLAGVDACVSVICHGEPAVRRGTV